MLDLFKKEVSYRKQIARKLSAQYGEGIYRPRPKYYTVILKSKLGVTEGRCMETAPLDRSYTT